MPSAVDVRVRISLVSRMRSSSDKTKGVRFCSGAMLVPTAGLDSCAWASRGRRDPQDEERDEEEEDEGPVKTLFDAVPGVATGGSLVLSFEDTDGAVYDSGGVDVVVSGVSDS